MVTTDRHYTVIQPYNLTTFSIWLYFVMEGEMVSRKSVHILHEEQLKSTNPKFDWLGAAASKVSLSYIFVLSKNFLPPIPSL